MLGKALEGDGVHANLATERLHGTQQSMEEAHNRIVVVIACQHNSCPSLPAV